MNQTQRIFYPGDEWLYFKLYTGIKSADQILIKSIYPVIKRLEKEARISKAFFLRYTDPDFHIRFRVLTKHPADSGYIINLINKKLKRACANEWISKIEISTYVRELERYGDRYIEWSESLFSIDSECILSLLKYLNKKDENNRWMIALKLIDTFFDDIQYSLEQRSLYMENMSNSFKMEFGFNMYNSKQLNSIYRERKKAIASTLDATQQEALLIDTRRIIDRRSKRIRALLSGGTAVPATNFSSYIHLSMNRLFRSRNREHELLIYDFLSRYYKSEIAKSKQKNEQLSQLSPA